jgi:hypothetical protein
MPRLTALAAGMLVCTVVSAQTGVVTYHNDNSRTGQNISETVLTPANVSSGRFGKLFSHRVDGDVYAQPLYVPKLAIPGKGIHDVVFVATTADSVYAFDADDIAGSNADALWHVSLIDADHGARPGATPVGAATDLACSAIAPQVGITATPAIDSSHSIIYVEAFSKENDALIHRLHALDIANGAQVHGGPAIVAGRVRRKGQNDVLFDPSRQLGRAALLLSNGIVYVAYGSNCDKPRFHGWMFAYDATTLIQKGTFVTAPEHGKAAIWMSGAGPAADSTGNVFVATGDGWFDTQAIPARELGDSILEIALRADSLALIDYFTPFNQVSLARHDGDLGSGGVLLLPDQAGKHPHVLIAVGKTGTLYVVDRGPMTIADLHYCNGCTTDRQIVQELPGAVSGGVWGMPAYWKNTVYVSGSQDVLRAFSLKSGALVPMTASVSTDICEYPGCGLSVSAHGEEDGILWALQVGAYDSKAPAVLKAYDAGNLGRILYTSNQHGERDVPGGAVKFSVPTVVAGKVYVGGAGQLTVFGLLSRP